MINLQKRSSKIAYVRLFEINGDYWLAPIKMECRKVLKTAGGDSFRILSLTDKPTSSSQQTFAEQIEQMSFTRLSKAKLVYFD